MTMQLYCFGESGNSYKAALTMTLAGVEWEPVYVDFFKGTTRTDEYRELNVMGEAPVLVDGDFTLTQSGAIQEYIIEQTGKLGGKDKREHLEVLRWMFWDNHKLSSQAGMTRFLMNFLPEDKRPQPVIDFMQGRLKSAYATLDTALAGRDWLVGEAISAADTACCGYLYYPEPFGFDRKDYTNIDVWLDRIAAQPGWKHPYDMMPGSPADRA